MGIMSWFKKKKVVEDVVEEVSKEPKKTDREEFIEFIDSYLLSLKLSGRGSHSIIYDFYKPENGLQKNLNSKDKWKLNLVAIETGYKEHFKLVLPYFRGNIKIIIYTEKVDKKYNYYLSIEILDEYMKRIMTDEFKDKIRKMFGKPVFTSNEFSRSDGRGLNYDEQIVSTKASLIRDQFIELIKLVEHLEVDSQNKKPEEDDDFGGTICF